MTVAIDSRVDQEATDPMNNVKPVTRTDRVKPLIVADSVLDLVGGTPVVKLSRLSESIFHKTLPIEIFAKCEFMNPGGSVKDRIGKKMLEEAECYGLTQTRACSTVSLAQNSADTTLMSRPQPGDTLIEPTSGNTGIGICMAAAIKGYKTIMTMPEKMSGEKVNIMKALGAKIVRTPTEAPFDSPESHISVAYKLRDEMNIRNSTSDTAGTSSSKAFILDQYANINNPIAHEEGTGAELLQQLNDDIDAVFIAAGTGGTLTGVAKAIKKRLPGCLIIGVDPVGSILAQPEHLNDERRLQSYLVEGIGYDFVPEVLDRNLVDEWVKVDDGESFTMARALIKKEGLLVGGSSGSAIAGLLKWVNRKLESDNEFFDKWRTRKSRSSSHPEFKSRLKFAVILPDSCRNYMTKFIDDQWMIDNRFQAPTILHPLKSVSRNITCLKSVKDLPEETFITVPCFSLSSNVQEIFSAIQSAEPKEVMITGAHPAGLADLFVVGTLDEAAVLKVLVFSQELKSVVDRTVKFITEEDSIDYVVACLMARPTLYLRRNGSAPVALSRPRFTKYLLSSWNSADTAESRNA